MKRSGFKRALRVDSATAKTSVPLPTPPCSVCTKPFTPSRMGQVVCGLACARRVPVVARNTLKAAAKVDRALTRAQREAMKTLPELRAEAQAEFNAWIRLRDAGLSCICCGRRGNGDPLTGGEWDAGHYRSRGAAPELAFHEDNVHAQLKQCNRRSWDVASYRAELLCRIGPVRLAAIEGPHPAKRYTRDDLRAIRDEYKARRTEKRNERIGQ